MTEVNESISIYDGTFKLIQADTNIEVNGNIWFDWFPNIGAKFTGKIISDSGSHEKVINRLGKFELNINDSKFGECFINKSYLSVERNIEGSLVDFAVLGNRAAPVSKVTFSVPNLREFLGGNTKRKIENAIQTGLNRLIFHDDIYTITVDKNVEYRMLRESLESKGGYVFLFSGELTKKRGKIALFDLKEVFHCFSTFITFLNGRRCSPLLIQGVHEGETIWCDYTGYFVDQYKNVNTWPQKHSIEGLDNLWRNFRKFWKDENIKDFLNTAIHWYVEANSNSAFTEGSIIMTQVALELAYNVIVIEEKKLLIGKDADNISASNKIRLLLSYLDVSHEVPASLTTLKLIINQEITDGPDAFVQIRNAIVHSQEEKRKKIKNMDLMVKYEALQLGIWYLELSILYILKFEGKYFNRCSGAVFAGEGEESVPWAKKRVSPI